MSLSDKSAITGVGETAFVKGTEKTAVDMMLEASRKAIADAGLKPSDIDGMVPPPIYTTSEEMAANLGIEVLRYASTVHMGGASPTTALQNAAMAIASGLCDHVLVTLGWNGYSALRPKPGAPPTRPMNMNTLTNTIQGYYIPYGVFLPVQMYAWLATRHSQLHCVGPEAIGAVAMACDDIAEKVARIGAALLQTGLESVVVRDGGVHTARLKILDNGEEIEVRNGIVHHWYGAVLVPDVTPA